MTHVRGTTMSSHQLALAGAALLTALLASVATDHAALAGTATGPVVVTTDHGALRGSSTDRGTQFLGIPYAAPPVGPLRWRPPQPAAAWTGVRAATAYGPNCAQPRDDLLAKPESYAEDCLYLNVYAPPGAAGKALPVMVWFHGGGFFSGAGSDYDGSYLAAQGNVIVVTVNYRLGVFGFLTDPALATAPGQGTGDYGMMDQIAALQWVRSNAAAFGGAPSDVTIFGQSAGGVSVCDLLVSPPARGLFQRAIIESGPCAAESAITQQTAGALGELLAVKVGCWDSSTAAACLRSRSTKQLVEATGLLPGDLLLSQGSDQFSGLVPSSGTAVLPQAPMDAIAAGDVDRVPIIVGTTADETRPFVDDATQAGLPVNPLTYALFVSVYASDPLRTLQDYPLGTYGGDARQALSAVVTDSQFSCPAETLASDASRTTPTWQYEFSDRTPPDMYGIPETFPWGAYHASEIAFVFGSPGNLTVTGKLTPFTPAEETLSRQMLAAWTTFARTGDPNAPGMPHWAPARPGSDVVRQFDLGSTADRAGFAAEHRCGLWATEHAIIP